MDLIIKIALFAVGVGLLIVAVAIRQSLSGRRVVDFAADKLGVTLKTDAFGLIVLASVVMIGAPIFLLYKGYEDKVSTLNQTLNQKVAELNVLLAEFKDHELTLYLSFPDSEFPDLNRMNWPPTAYVQRQGERAPSAYGLVTFAKGPGGVVANFKKLRSGDVLYVVAEDNGKTWKSLEMVAPAAQLQMKQAEAPR